MGLTRREMIENCISRGVLLAGVPISASLLPSLWAQGESGARKPTPTEVLGPFFKKGAPNQAILRAPGDAGFPLKISGKVVNTNGDPVPAAQIDIWQADYAGHYDLAGYRYRTKLVVEPGADYSLETVMPGHYDDRPAQHIHYMISAPGHNTLITQVYFATDPWFQGDPDKNYHRGSIVRNRELVRPVILFEQPGGARAAITFDICLEKA